MSSVETETGRSPLDEARLAARDLDDAEPATIERNIDETRADVRATLSALEHRLSVDRLIELTVGRIRDRGGAFATNLSDAATQNPIPLLLASIGVGWMMLTSRRNGHDDSRVSGPSVGARAAGVRDSVAGAGDAMAERVRSAVESSREAIDQAAESVRDTATQAAEQTRAGAKRAREGIDQVQERMQTMMHEQPLMLGVLGLAAGALIGALLPSTESEDRLLGDVRDKALRGVARAPRPAARRPKSQSATGQRPPPHGADTAGDKALH